MYGAGSLLVTSYGDIEQLVLLRLNFSVATKTLNLF